MDRESTMRGRRRVAKDQICSASAVAVKTNTPMQPRLNTVAETAELFNLGPLIVINLRCIPTLSSGSLYLL